MLLGSYSSYLAILAERSVSTAVSSGLLQLPLLVVLVLPLELHSYPYIDISS
jgi:hypothetical protein